jgi:adenylate cyclase
LDPNFSYAYFFRADILSILARPQEAITMAEKGMRLDPVNRDLYLYEVGFANVVLGRYPEAIAALHRNVAAYPNSLPGHLYLAIAYVELGREAEARAEAKEVLRVSPQFSTELYEKSPVPNDRLLKRFAADMRRAGLK